MEYQASFEVTTTLSAEELSRVFYEHFDGVVVERQGRVIVTVIDESRDGFEFAMGVVRALEAHAGVSVVRCDADIVDTPEIAERLDVSRQAVGNWIAGTRGCGFPRPIGCPGGKRLWTWGQIVEWARATGRLIDEPLPLTLDETARVDAYLAERRRMVRVRSTSLRVREGGQKAAQGRASNADYVTSSRAPFLRYSSIGG